MRVWIPSGWIFQTYRISGRLGMIVNWLQVFERVLSQFLFETIEGMLSLHNQW